MNELIAQLAEKAAQECEWLENETNLEVSFDDKTFLIPANFIYKFADMVVKECMTVCKSRVGNSDYNTGRMHCVSDLKEQFGVEE